MGYEKPPEGFPPGMLQWDYSVVPIGGTAEQIQQQLRHLGWQGWEIIVAAPVPGGFTCILKRPYTTSKA